MPYFSFSIKGINSQLKEFNIKPNELYYSKNTEIWKILNKKSDNSIISLNYQKRLRIEKLGKNILFFLPPSIGVGDAIEYAIAIKELRNKKSFNKIAVAFAGKYSFIFKKYFKIKNTFSYVISKNQMLEYDTHFHFTLEIKPLINQKYFRTNIYNEILKYFKIVNEIKYNKYLLNKKIKKISIFPISTSPLRSMPVEVISNLIKKLEKKFQVEIFFDNNSEISNFLYKNLKVDKVSIHNPKNTIELVDQIKKIEYGIFMDSGPIHIAKLFNKRGLLLETTVSKNILLNNYFLIKSIENKYSSSFCEAPCGLTDIFNFKNNFGCYDSLEIKDNFFKKNKFSFLNNRGVKNNYLEFIKKPVGCINSLNVQNIYNNIIKDIDL
tara:strand:+ start:9488 stop:10627 length:1140 start_codon:yes stop_codon:yes gene_type:complete